MARGKYERGSLTEAEIKRFQRRLSHYLKDFRYRNDLTAADVANKLGYAVPKYSLLESEVKPHGRYTSSLDFLAALAELDNLSVAEFLCYLDPSAGRKEQSGEEKQLYTWETIILGALNGISIGTRKKFTELCKESLKEGKDKLEVMVRIMNLLQKKDLKALESLEEMVKSFNC